MQHSSIAESSYMSFLQYYGTAFNQSSVKKYQDMCNNNCLVSKFLQQYSEMLITL